MSSQPFIHSLDNHSTVTFVKNLMNKFNEFFIKYYNALNVKSYARSSVIEMALHLAKCFDPKIIRMREKKNI